MEVVVVMVLVGVIAVFVSDVIFYEINMYDKVLNQTDVLQTSRKALEMLARDIRQIAAPDSIYQASEEAIVFDDVDDNVIAYSYSNSLILRNGDKLINSVNDFEFNYFDAFGAKLTTPVNDPTDIFSISISLTTSLGNGQLLTLNTKVKPRNF